MKKRKLLFLLCFLISTGLCYSQVGIGINTNNPQATLDVNGDLQLRGEIKFGTGTDEETAGTTGQYLMSQGPGLPPKWENIEIPGLDTGDYVLRDTQFSEDRVGISLINDITSDITDNSPLTSEWSVIEGLTTNFTTTNTENRNRIMVTFQTVAQGELSGGKKDGYATNFIGGIFIGTKGSDRSAFTLVLARPSKIYGAHYPQNAFSLIASFDDLAVGEYELVVAFQRRGSTNTELDFLPLHIGKGLTVTPVVSNDFMNKSILRVDVFEP